jgi:hypothetical protein
MDAIAAAVRRRPVSPSSTTASQPGDHRRRGPPEKGHERELPERTRRREALMLRHGLPDRRSEAQGGDDEQQHRGDQAHDGQGVLPGVAGQPAGDPMCPDRQPASGQVHRLPRARHALPGPGRATSTPSISSRWTSRWLGG